MEESVGLLKKECADLRTEFSIIKDENKNLKSKVNNMEEEISVLKSCISDIRETNEGGYHTQLNSTDDMFEDDDDCHMSEPVPPLPPPMYPPYPTNPTNNYMSINQPLHLSTQLQSSYSYDPLMLTTNLIQPSINSSPQVSPSPSTGASPIILYPKSSCHPPLPLSEIQSTKLLPVDDVLISYQMLRCILHNFHQLVTVPYIPITLLMMSLFVATLYINFLPLLSC